MVYSIFTDFEGRVYDLFMKTLLTFARLMVQNKFVPEIIRWFIVPLNLTKV